mmetsp:Transcript_87365/g.271415  ORF Transcript_87365/g.271415 Transcript_87365/m.271415 type:complete len:253 (+) Transcript_87365:292-1050(+)
MACPLLSKRPGGNGDARIVAARKVLLRRFRVEVLGLADDPLASRPDDATAPGAQVVLAVPRVAAALDLVPHPRLHASSALQGARRPARLPAVHVAAEGAGAADSPRQAGLGAVPEVALLRGGAEVGQGADDPATGRRHRAARGGLADRLAEELVTAHGQRAVSQHGLHARAAGIGGVARLDAEAELAPPLGLHVGRARQRAGTRAFLQVHALAPSSAMAEDLLATNGVRVPTLSGLSTVCGVGRARVCSHAA